ncbi:MAG: M48 family metalloprotease [Actinomycetota bacterium]|nr:M48 family metalloprotease [Actinomycetota bacterium]
MRMTSLFEVRTGRLRLPLAVVTAVLVAEGAVLLLRPRDGVIEPAPVNVRSYFSEHELARARDFRRPQLALAGGQAAIEIAVLVLLVLRPPTRLRTPFRRPLVAGALAGGALSVIVAVAPLPLGAVARARAVDAGLITQSWGGWAGDVAKSTMIGAVMTSAGAALLLGLMRRFPRAWWAPGSALAVGLGAVFLYAGPVALDPLFNKFKPLPEGPVRSSVLDLARQAAVKVGEVYEVDASRRTTTANAYVTGLGHTKRVVLYDTLLRRFSRDETRLVVAHELGHVHYDDVPRGLLYLALVAPAALFAAAQLTDRLSPRGIGPGAPAALPAAALALVLVSAGVGVISNQLSRRVEARADTYSLALTSLPRPFISSERRLAVQNFAEPDPPAWQTALLGTHPPILSRIGAAVAYERGARAG